MTKHIMPIHATSIISDKSILGKNVTVDAYVVVEEGVVIGDGVHLQSHCVIKSGTTIGNNTVVHSFAVLGDAPLDLSYKKEDTFLIIGDNCVIRESCAIHKGSGKDDFITKIGDNCLIMTGVHIGHDCKLGNNVIIASNSVVSGHCHIYDNVIISGLVALHQFVRIGESAIIGGGGAIGRDVAPFGMTGKDGVLTGVNLIGLKRSGIKKESLKNILSVFQKIKSSEKTFSAVINDMKDIPDSYVQKIYTFISADSNRGILRGKETK